MRLQQAISALEAQRNLLGDEFTDRAVEALRAQFTQEQTPAPGNERPRLTACLVANLTSPDPKKLPRLLVQGFNMIGEIVRQYGGKIHKMKSVYLIALFNTAPDDPVRAAHAALEMQLRLSQFSEELEANGEGSLTFRAGLNTGVLASEGGPLKGEAIDIAGIISQRAPPNSVLVSQPMFAYVSNEFALQPAANVDVGGRQIQTYHLLEARQSPAVRSQNPALEKPFIGRVDELHSVLQQVERLGSGHSGLMVIMGESGLGKTRLVCEVRRAAAMSQWLEARCNATPVNLIFGAWNDMLLSLCGSHVLEAARVTGKRLQSWLDERGIPELYAILASQLGLAAFPGNSQHIMRETVEAWQTILQTLARQRPTVIVFEETQRIDSSSLALLETLIESSRELPILWIVTSQPLYNEPAAATLTRLARKLEDDFVYLGLEPLEEAESLSMLRGLANVRQLPDPFEEGILHRACGNPLLLLQVVQAMIDKRGLYRDVRGEWQVAASAMRESMPGTLPEVTALRLSTLSIEERNWLELAAVAGDALLPGLVATLPAAPKREAFLGRLHDMDFIECIDDKVHFANPALAEAIYGQINDSQRQELHRRVVVILTKQGELGGSWLALTAYHMSSGMQTQSALRAYGDVKEWAYAHDALKEVSDIIDGMLALLRENESPEQVARLLVEQQDVLTQINPDDERPKMLLQKAYDLWIKLGETAEAATTLLREAVHHAGTPREQECYLEAQRLLEHEDPQHEMLPGIYLQQALYAASQGQDSREMFQRARTLAAQLQDVNALAHIYFEMGLYLANARHLGAALSSFQQAFSYFGQISDGSPDDKIMTSNYLADLLDQLGRPAEGEYYANEAVSEAHQGSDLVQVLPYITLSESYALQARWDDAFHAIASANADLAPPDMPPRFWRGRWQFEHGDRLDGLEVMREALPTQNLECVLIFIDYLLEANFTQEASVRLHQLSKDERLKTQRTMMPLTDYYDRLRGRLAAAERDYTRALSLLNRAMFQFEQRSFVVYNISTKRILATVLMERHNSGDEPKARSLLTESAAQCKTLSLHAESRRIQHLLSRYWPS